MGTSPSVGYSCLVVEALYETSLCTVHPSLASAYLNQLANKCLQLTPSELVARPSYSIAGNSMHSQLWNCTMDMLLSSVKNSEDSTRKTFFALYWLIYALICKDCEQACGVNCIESVFGPLPLMAVYLEALTASVVQ